MHIFILTTQDVQAFIDWRPGCQGLHTHAKIIVVKLSSRAQAEIWLHSCKGCGPSWNIYGRHQADQPRPSYGVLEGSDGQVKVRLSQSPAVWRQTAVFDGGHSHSFAPPGREEPQRCSAVGARRAWKAEHGSRWCCNQLCAIAGPHHRTAIPGMYLKPAVFPQTPPTFLARVLTAKSDGEVQSRYPHAFHQQIAGLGSVDIAHSTSLCSVLLVLLLV